MVPTARKPWRLALRLVVARLDDDDHNSEACEGPSLDCSGFNRDKRPHGRRRVGTNQRFSEQGLMVAASTLCFIAIEEEDGVGTLSRDSAAQRRSHHES